jgi:hypothetical protein
VAEPDGLRARDLPAGDDTSGQRVACDAGEPGGLGLTPDEDLFLCLDDLGKRGWGVVLDARAWPGSCDRPCRLLVGLRFGWLVPLGSVSVVVAESGSVELACVVAMVSRSQRG